ncbi:MAG: class I SAM-dependent methyltransferase, partial [Elusimicrobiota bacterium]
MTGLLRGLIRRLIKAGEEGLRNHQAVMRLLAGVSAASLLDVGCADGTKAEAYARGLGIPLDRVKGIESRENYAAEAREKFEVYKVDVEKDPFPVPDEAFDMIVCNQVLEHLKNIYLPLQEMDRALKTGGSLLIGVPNLAGLYNRFLLLLGRQPLAVAIDGPHVRGFAHCAFLRFLMQNPNFEVTALESSNLYPLPYPLLALSGGKFTGLSSFTFYRLKKKAHNPAACGWKPGPSMDT